MKSFYWVLIPIILTACNHSSNKNDNEILRIDFENSLDKHKYFYLSGLVEILPLSSFDRSNALRVQYQGYDNGSKRVTSRIQLDEKVDSATLYYDVCFDNDFQWVKGGKLHGLGPDNPVTGGNKRNSKGWSARILFKDEGKIQNYLYDQNYSLTYGFGSKSKDIVFSKGIWHRVTMQVQLNSIDKSDGFSKIYIDGTKVIENYGIVFRTDFSQGSNISEFLFSTFHGGNSNIYSPKNSNGYTSVYALFDNIVVKRGIQLASKIGVDSFSC